MLIATLSPLVSHAREICAHPLVEGVRFNAVTPVPRSWSRRETLERLLALAGDKPLYLDLKARQLRIVHWCDPLYDCVALTHRIRVNLPATVLFKDCAATIVAVDGNRIILENPPRYAVGRGQPVNILDPSLEIEGFLTDTCRQYAEAAAGLGVCEIMLSFLERVSDLKELWAIHPGARPTGKIESLRGLEFVRREYPPLRDRVRLMAARDDLYINMGPDKLAMLAAERLILAHDPEAIAASRILTSLETQDEPSLGDLKDLESLFRLGYRRFMLSDGLCLNRTAFRRVMRLYERFLETLRTQGSQP